MILFWKTLTGSNFESGPLFLFFQKLCNYLKHPAKQILFVILISVLLELFQLLSRSAFRKIKELLTRLISKAALLNGCLYCDF